MEVDSLIVFSPHALERDYLVEGYEALVAIEASLARLGPHISASCFPREFLRASYARVWDWAKAGAVVRPGVRNALLRKVSDTNETSGADVLLVGRLVEEKRPQVALHVAAELAGSGWGGRMVFVGGGHVQHGLERLSFALGLASRVVFLGEVSDARLAAKYRAARVVIVPSLCESYSVVVAEAVSWGVTVVAVDRAGTREAGGSSGKLRTTSGELHDLVQ